MKEKIKETVKNLKIIYYGLMVMNIAFIMFISGYLFPIEEIPGKEDYILQCICILMTLACIPLGLWWFKFNFVKKFKERSLEEALRYYINCNIVRIMLVSAPIMIGFAWYMVTTSNNTYLFCACMAFIATLFCVPSEERLKNELDLPEEIN